MKLHINTPLVTFTSDEINATREYVYDLVEKAMRGDLNFLIVMREGSTTYIPSSVLTNSIIGVIEDSCRH